jgi:DNA-binding NarL/FixJ family response regulator
MNNDLTARELEILVLIAHGKSNKDIAVELSISLYTVQNHVRNLLQKLGVSNRTEAAHKYWMQLAEGINSKNN